MEPTGDAEFRTSEGRPTRVVVVDDQLDVRDSLEIALAQRGFDVAAVATASEALELVGSGTIDVVVTDLCLQAMDGIELCERIHDACPDMPVLLMTRLDGLETALAAMRAGAFDFITKPVLVDSLELALRRAAQHRALRDEVHRLRRAVTDAERRSSNPPDPTALDSGDQFLPLAEIERRYILRVIDALGGNKAEAARILGVGRRTLYRKLDLYEDSSAGRRSQ